jgi:hypothetical protein
MNAHIRKILSKPGFQDGSGGFGQWLAATQDSGDSALNAGPKLAVVGLVRRNLGDFLFFDG